MSAFNGEFGGPLSHIWDRQRVLAPLLIAPAILYIVILVGVPFFMAIYYSLSDATTGSQSLHFVGLRNFQAVFKDPVFRKSLVNTFIFTLVSQALVQRFSGKVAGTVSYIAALDCPHRPGDYRLDVDAGLDFQPH
jgi:ABC-type sugar transport system permease subunit